jgi:glycerophosphoryl diester phosphodiesterase
MATPLFAHRLGRAYGPDSSARALAGALRSKADGLETDVCLTADEGLVLIHDPLLALGTTVEGWAHQRTLAKIRAGVLLDHDGQPSTEVPLTLDELFEATPTDLPIQVEVKAYIDSALAVRTARVICERYRRRPERERIEITSFHSAAVAAAAAFGYRARLVIHADYAPEALATWAVARGIAGVSVEHFLLTPKFTAVMRLAGLSVSTGTVNDPELLLRALEIGQPDAVCTDMPGEMRAELAARTEASTGATAPMSTALAAGG